MEQSKDPVLRNIVKLFVNEINPKTPVNEALEKIPQYFINFKTTGDIYMDTAIYTAQSLMEIYRIDWDFNIRENKAITYALSCVINWGIYPHLPKSLHVEFLQQKHWVFTPAPTRMFRPPEEMFDALEKFFAAQNCISIHPLFVQHAYAIFSFVDKERLPNVINNLQTAVVFAGAMSMMRMKINSAPLIAELIMNRTDFLEALEASEFPPAMLAKAIALPPKTVDANEYYKELFDKIFSAARSGQGRKLASAILCAIFKACPKRFYQYCNMQPLLEWPTEESIGNILWTIETLIIPEMQRDVFINPIPIKLLFIAALTEGAINERCIRLIKNCITNGPDAIDFVKIVVTSSSLSPLGLDGFIVETREDGVYIVESDIEVADQLEIMEKMRQIVSEIIPTEYLKEYIELLPGTFGSVQFISLILPRVPQVKREWAVPLLNFLTKVRGEVDIADVILEIARNVFSACSDIEKLPKKVIDTFAGDIPEMLSIEYEEEEERKKDTRWSIKPILDDLSSPLPALRGRGLFELRRGIMTQDSPLRDENNIIQIFPVVEKQLQSSETFVFLNAIRTLESIGDVFPHLVTERLCDQFPQSDVGVSLKVAQALMLLARRAGPGLVHSREGNLCGFFVAAFARGVAHESSIVRSAALSDLASFVEALGFGCSSFLADIVAACDNAWQMHHPVDVRRAASYLCYKLILVLGDGFDECAPSDLKRLAEVVKRGREGELDEVAHQNAEDCYQAMWDCAASYL